jgi:peptidoglycan/LPS O-acetylase OafA/YrhL
VAATAAHESAPALSVAPPPGNPRFPLFDSLRGLAVLAVVTFHVSLVTGALERDGFGDVASVAGAMAPPVFFAISGFLLYRPWIVRPPGVGRFARGRVLRILPAYWLALTVLAIFPGVVGAFSGDWWRYYFFLQSYEPETLSRGIPVAWTLCVEATFYITLPLWALAFARRSLKLQLVALALLALAGAAVQVAALRLEVSHLVGQSLLGQVTWMAVGMMLAVVSVSVDPGGPAGRRLADRAVLWWLLAAAAFTALVLLRSHGGGLLGIIAALQTPQPWAKSLADVALSAAIVAFVLLPAVFAGDRLPHRVLTAQPFAWIGVVSFGIYLWHLTIAEFITLPTMPQHFSADGLDLTDKIPFAATPILLVLTVLLSAGVAALSYYYVELPFLRRKDRRR